MRILFISRDKSLFQNNSSSLKKLIEASAYLEQIHVVVITKSGEGYKTCQIRKNLFIHPTNSKNKWFQAYDAFSTGELQASISFKLVVDIIEADGPLETGFAAYLLSRKYKKNFLITVSKNLNTYIETGGVFTAWFRRKVSQFTLEKAHAIRVSSQIIGEVLCARNPNLENKIYITPEPAEAILDAEPDKTLDIRKAYPQFNITIITVIESFGKKEYRTLLDIMSNLLFHYRRAGLIIIDKGSNVSKFGAHKIPFIVIKKDVDDITPYYREAQIFLDISTKNKDGGAMIEAALSGCPIVSAANPFSNYIVKNGQNGFIVNPENPGEVVSKIRSIIETPGLRESIRLFRHQTEEMFAKTREEYWPTLLEIWKIVSEKKTETEKTDVEEYASRFVYTLRQARKYMRDATKTMENLEKNLESSLKNKIQIHGGKKRGIPIKDPFNVTREETFNVDKVLKERK